MGNAKWKALYQWIVILKEKVSADMSLIVKLISIGSEQMALQAL